MRRLAACFVAIADAIQAANSQGIQTLLEAEKEAAKVVAKARQCESPGCWGIGLGVVQHRRWGHVWGGIENYGHRVVVHRHPGCWVYRLLFGTMAHGYGRGLYGLGCLHPPRTSL
jgi:hypothetical protein